jgi:hypothetical protein
MTKPVVRFSQHLLDFIVNTQEGSAEPGLPTWRQQGKGEPQGSHL